MPDVEFVRELAAIPIGIAALYFLYKLAVHFSDKTHQLASNHMNALAQAVEKLADAVQELRDWLREKGN